MAIASRPMDPPPFSRPWPAHARVVVTGAAGFIGGHVLRALRASGVARIVTLDLRPIAASASVAEPFGGSCTEVVHTCRSILEPIDDALEDVDVVFHLAARVGVPQSIRAPLDDLATNVQGTLSLLDACRRVGVPRFVYSSSAAVYGAPEYLPIDEWHPTRPCSPYGLSKLSGERYSLLYGELYSMSVVALRYFNVYGLNQPADNGYAAVVPQFLERAARRLPLHIEGDGTHSRDFIHVADVARANVLAATSTLTGVVNVGSGVATSIAELARLVGGPGYPIEYVEPRVGDIAHSVAATGKARDNLDFSAAIPLDRGLAELLNARVAQSSDR